MPSHQINLIKKRRFWQSKYFYLLVAGILAASYFIGINLDYANEVVIVNETPSQTEIKSDFQSLIPHFTMLQKIKEGIDLLRKSPPLDYETTYMSTSKKGVVTKTGELTRKQIALAILNKKTGEIIEKRVWLKEADSKNYKKTGIMYLTPAIAGEKIDIQPEWWNGFNTFYKIVDNPELVVIANKYLFPSKYLDGLQEKSKTSYTDIVYAPYSNQLHLPDIIEAGKDYLEKNINQAFSELWAAKVRSHFWKGALVTEGIGKDFIKDIILIEHIDPDGFKTSSDKGLELSERVLTVIGANQDYAYRYTGSPAGASGMAQFIQPTYELMVNSYPEAKLIKNYNEGMANHVNAIKAMVLFFDSHKKEIAGKVTRQDIVKSLGITEEMLAATYNGGPSKVVTSVNRYGLSWLTSQLKMPLDTKILQYETINYVQKFQAIKNLHLFGSDNVN